MKFVSHLSPAVKRTLKEAQDHHPSGRVRQRAHALQLSHKSYSLSQLAEVFDVHRNTVSQWIDDWETFGLIGLYDNAKSGRPTILSDAEIEPKRAMARLEAETGKVASYDTYKRCLKKKFLPLEAVATIQQRTP